MPTLSALVARAALPAALGVLASAALPALAAGPAAPLAAADAPLAAPSGAQGGAPVPSADAAAGVPLTLEQAVALARERNERVQAAQARADAARARVAQARAFFFPELSTTASYTYRLTESAASSGTSGGAVVSGAARSTFSGGATARMTVFDARSYPLYRQARLLGEAAGLDAREETRLVGFEAADAFLATLNAQQVLGAAEQRLAFARASLQDAQARAEAGLASSNDVTRAKLELALAEVQLAQGKGGLETARLELGYLLAAPPAASLVAPDALLGAAADAPRVDPGDTGDILERRLDLGAQRRRAQGLDASATEPLMRLLPTLGVSATYRGQNDSGPGSWFDRDGAFVSADLAWTLFDGGERYAERRERLASARAARLELGAAERRVSVDLARAQVDLDNARATLAQGEVAVAAARQNAEETAELYRQGLASQLAVADAALRLYDAEVQLARGRYGLGAALLNVRAASGLDALGEEP